MMIGYFDNAATTYKKPDGMYEYMSNYMLSCGANVGRGSYESSITSGKLVAETRSNILKLMDAPEYKAVVFCPSATIAMNTVIFGSNLKDGDIVYVSHFEHNAVLRPLYQLQKTISFTIKYLPMASNNRFEFDINEIEQAIAKDKPRMVIVSHVSNVLGIVAPVEKIAKIAHNNDAIMIVDGAQSCGLIKCDLSYVDYYIFAGHKTLLGPTGIGGFICNRASKLSPFIFGGTGIDSINTNMPESIPERFEAGTLNLLSIVGLSYSVKWILSNYDEVQRRERENLKRLYTIISCYPFFNIVSPYPAISSIVSCYVKGYTSDEIGNVLSERGISTRTGLHCAPLAHEYIGSSPEGLIRFSISPFTSEEDFACLEKVLKELSQEII